jgi:hypothetical protein
MTEKAIPDWTLQPIATELSFRSQQQAQQQAGWRRPQSRRLSWTARIAVTPFLVCSALLGTWTFTWFATMLVRVF